jgi:HEAT repeat protein
MSSPRACLLVLTLLAAPLSAQTANRFLDRGRSDWLKDLEDKSPTVRRSAAFALGKIGDDRDLRTLVELAQKDKEETGVRAAAATACGDIVTARDGDPALWSKVNRAMRRLVEQDRDPRVRRAAIYTLGTFGPFAAPEIPLLRRKLLDKEEHPTVRQNAAWALGRLKGEANREVIDDLIQAVENDPEALVRRDAATALGDVLLRSSDAPVLDKEYRNAGVRALLQLARAEQERRDKGDPVVQKTALVKLYPLVGAEDKRNADVVINLVEHEDPETARLAAFILAKSSNDAARKPEVVRALALALREDEARIQEAAVVCLGALGPDAAPAVPDLIACLKSNRSASIQQAAAVALEHIGLPAHPAIPALTERVLRPSSDEAALQARRNAAIAISGIHVEALKRGDSELVQQIRRQAAPDLLKVIENPAQDPTVRSWAASLFVNIQNDLETFGADRVLEKVLDEVDPKSLVVRYNAARALAFSKRDKAPVKAAQVLVQMMQDDRMKVQTGTASTGTGGLGESGRGGSQTQVLLGDDARYMGAQALGAIGPGLKDQQAVLAALREAARDSNMKLSDEAKAALRAAGE